MLKQVQHNSNWLNKMSQNLLYKVEDLHSAREFLKHYKNPVELTNVSGSTRYYGMLTLGYIFKTLQAEFPQVVKIIVDVDTDHSALFTAIKLGFKDILARFEEGAGFVTSPTYTKAS